METVNIHGDNRFESYTRVREACRGILVEDGRILLTYETNTDQWFIPGGGMEEGENREKCCIREMAEETGVLVQPGAHFLTINEYYEDWLFVSHYFVCQALGETQRHLTQREEEVGLEPRWMGLTDAVEVFSKHQSYADDEMKRGAYLREYNALKAYERWREK